MEFADDLLENVKTAIRRTVAAVHEQHPRDVIAGYALLTDDDLSSLTFMATTNEALAASDEPDLLFCPTDWPYDPASAAFGEAARQLRDAAASELLRTHVDGAFAILVRSLVESRAEGLFAPDVFLSVLSTDPSPYLESLETAAVRELNEPSLVERREAFLARWEMGAR